MHHFAYRDGVLHAEAVNLDALAAAVGTPTIGLFGPGEENIWFPYTPAFPGGSSKNIALRKDVPCHPCHLNVCNRTGSGYMECMNLLSVSEVFNAVRERM